MATDKMKGGKRGGAKTDRDKLSAGKRSDASSTVAKPAVDAPHRTSVPDLPHPWHVPVALDEIPPQGLQRELHASMEICANIAAFLNVNYIKDLNVKFEVIPQAGGRYSVSGKVTARVGQNCVVTLEPIESQIAEQIDVTFLPADQLPDGYNDSEKLDIAALINEEDDLEPITDGVIDLGRLAVEFLILGIDPYPRKAGAALAISPAAPDPAEHPFAGLAALKDTLKDKGGA